MRQTLAKSPAISDTILRSVPDNWAWNFRPQYLVLDNAQSDHPPFRSLGSHTHPTLTSFERLWARDLRVLLFNVDGPDTEQIWMQARVSKGQLESKWPALCKWRYHKGHATNLPHTKSKSTYLLLQYIWNQIHRGLFSGLCAFMLPLNSRGQKKMLSYCQRTFEESLLFGPFFEHNAMKCCCCCKYISKLLVITIN